MKTAFLASVLAAPVFLSFRIGPLLLLSRAIDHARAVALLLPRLYDSLRWEARTQYPVCLAQSRRER